MTFKRLITHIQSASAVSWLLMAVMGAGIGYAAWGEARWPLAAAALPLVIGLAQSRLHAFVLGLSYVLMTERAGPDFMAGWFGGDYALTAALWLGSGLIGAGAWCLGWTSATKPWRKALASVVAWLVTLLPPVSVVAMGHPLIAWGYLMGGSAWFGVVASVAVPALALAQSPKFAWTVGRRVVVSLGLIVLGASAGVIAYRPVENRVAGDAAAVSTQWGAAQDEWEILARIERMGRANERFAQETDTKVIIYPESVIERYTPALAPVIAMEITNPAAKAGQTVILGADLPNASGNLELAAIAFYPDGRTATAVARQTVPIALWRPWQDTGSYLVDWRANNLLTIKDGLRARVLFCFEEYVPILSLINEALDPHSIVIVMANTWSAREELGPIIQSQHSQGIANLFGKRLLRAENRPKPSN